MSTESKMFFIKPVIVGAIGWAVLLLSISTCYLIWLFSQYALLYFCAFLFAIFLVVWTVVSIFGVLQSLLDFKELNFLKPYLHPSEMKKRKTLFMLGLVANLLLILCNSMLIFCLYKLWQKVFP